LNPRREPRDAEHVGRAAFEEVGVFLRLCLARRITAGAALAMLGPGLWSVGARLYGWKRLEATPRKRSFNSPS